MHIYSIEDTTSVESNKHAHHENMEVVIKAHDSQVHAHEKACHAKFLWGKKKVVVCV